MVHQNKPGNQSFFLIKLAQGEFGLHKTFWTYSATVFSILTILLYASYSLGEALHSFILMLFFFVYSPFVIMGTISSSLHYKGKKLWPHLAMIFTGSWMLVFTVLFFLFVSEL